MAAPLRSDHVNYLIWRYLQEYGYGRAAIQLTRDWGNPDPETLPFSSSVHPNTLISLIQDGLSYDDLTAAVNSVPDIESGEAAPPSRARYTFVDHIDRDSSSSPDPSASLHVLDGSLQQNGQTQEPVHPASPSHPTSSTSYNFDRPTDLTIETNGDISMSEDSEEDSEESDDSTQSDDDASDDIEIDPPHHFEIDPSEYTVFEHHVHNIPLTPQRPSTLDIGQSSGTQTDVPAEPKLASALVKASISQADIMQIYWDNDLPNSLLVAGGTAFHSMTFAAATELGTTLPQPVLTSHLDVERGFYLSASAQLDKAHAVALQEQTDHGQTSGSIVMVKHKGADKSDEASIILENNAIVLALRWNPTANLLLSSATYNQGDGAGLIAIYPIDDSASNAPMMLSTTKMVLDTCWLASDLFAICGPSLLSVYKIVDTVSIQTSTAAESQGTLKKHVALLHSIQTTQNWEQMSYDSTTHLLACIASEQHLGLLDLGTILSQIKDTDLDIGSGYNALDFKTKTAHTSNITTAQWRPSSRGLGEDNIVTHPPILATASTDGSIILWKTQPALEKICQLQMHGVLVPAMALAWTPDGTILAAAGDKVVCFWTISPYEFNAAITSPIIEPEPEMEMNDTNEMQSDTHDYTPILSESIELGDYPATAEYAEAVNQTPFSDLKTDLFAIWYDDGRSGSTEPSAVTNTEVSAASTSETVADESYHTLVWNQVGSQLAFAKGERICVIAV